MSFPTAASNSFTTVPPPNPVPPAIASTYMSAGTPK